MQTKWKILIHGIVCSIVTDNYAEIVKGSIWRGSLKNQEIRLKAQS